jgi:RNA polymerase sigma-70 factor (ECF subfamily)
MDELTLLRRMRDDVAEPSADVLADSRRQLTQRQLAPQQVPTTLRRRPPMRRRIVIAAATAAAVTGGLVALNTGGTSEHRSTPPPVTRPAPALVLAATLLDQAAIHTLRAGDPAIKPGQYRDVRTHAWFSLTDGNGIYFLTEQRLEEWIPATEKGTWYWRYTRPISAKFFSAADERYVRTHNPDVLKTGVERYTGRLGVILTEHNADGSTSPAGDGIAPPDWGAPTSAWLSTLPRDPGALLQRLYADAPAPKPGSALDRYDFAFKAVGDVLRSGLVPADLRAALYRAAAKIPGIKLIDSAANLDGRRGVAIGRVQAGGELRHDIVFDSAAGQLIGERDVVVKQFAPHVPVGSTVASTAFSVGIADKPGF